MTQAASTGTSNSSNASASNQRRGNIGATSLERRREAEYERRHDDDYRGERHHPEVEVEPHPRRDLVAARHDEQVHHPPAERRPCQPRHGGEGETLGDQLAAHSLRART